MHPLQEEALMLEPQVLEGYVVASAWMPIECDATPSCMCARCKEQKASVNICEPCLVEVAQLMALPKQEVQEDEQAKPRRRGLVEWAGIVLLSSCVAGLGIMLVLRAVLH